MANFYDVRCAHCRASVYVDCAEAFAVCGCGISTPNPYYVKPAVMTRPDSPLEIKGGVDEVNNPAHYKLFPDMEAFDVIKATLTPDELRGYLKGNILKYRLRAGQKGPVEKCVAKADWYKARLFEQEQA